MLTRRKFVATLGAAAVGLATDAFLIEPNRIRITRHEIGAGGTGGQPPLRLVHLTDLHLRTLGDHEERIARAVNALAPSMMIITGDSIDRADRLEMLAEFLGMLDEATPKYAVLGNWEYFCHVDLRRLARVYERYGGRLLVNASVTHRHGDRDVLITGLDDMLAGTPQLVRALEGHAPMRDHVVLAHCPLQRDYLRGSLPPRPWRRGGRAEPPEPGSAGLGRYAPRLVLAGHTHGGQVNLMGFCPWRPWGSGPYVSGWYDDRAPYLYVSSGLGTVSVPMRLGALPELPCMEWRLDGDEAVGPRMIAWHAA